MQKAAIKRMDMQATKEFLAELKVLTHVHHLNLVIFGIFLFYGKFSMNLVRASNPLVTFYSG